MKTELNSVDVRVLAAELNEKLLSARVDKAYHIAEKELTLKFYSRLFGQMELVVNPGFMCLTKYSREAPQQPSSFAMQLRKNLGGFFVSSVRQHGFDRIIELEFDCSGVKKTLLVELFSKGNVLLLDSEKKILGLLEWQRWRDRTLSVGKQYEYPPSGVNPLELDREDFLKLLKSNEGSVAGALARMGFGGFYAEEICLNASVDNRANLSEVADADFRRLYDSMRALADKTKSGFKPSIVLDSGGRRVDVTPFPCRKYLNFRLESYASFNDAVDEYFSDMEKRGLEEQGKQALNEKSSKLESIRAQQDKAIEELQSKADKHRQAGDLLYQNISAVEEVVKTVREARKKGLNDKQITEKFLEGASKGIPEARLFKKLSKNELTLEL